MVFVPSFLWVCCWKLMVLDLNVWKIMSNKTVICVCKCIICNIYIYMYIWSSFSYTMQASCPLKSWKESHERQQVHQFVVQNLSHKRKADKSWNATNIRGSNLNNWEWKSPMHVYSNYHQLLHQPKNQFGCRQETSRLALERWNIRAAAVKFPAPAQSSWKCVAHCSVTSPYVLSKTDNTAANCWNFMAAPRPCCNLARLLTQKKLQCKTKSKW